ncbi:MAG TPA: glycosyltransferase family 39 protein [Gemmatimonadales bacterium]|nr:glycosyltransferase family 39 protein [Gemmatimonadales bacterium]
MSGSTERREERAGAPVLLVGGVILLALVLRFWHLGDWNFQATEIFTLRDSLRPRFTNPRPLGYLLNYYLVLPLRPLDEFGLRLLPALFGALAAPALYLVGRRLVGWRPALLGALLLAVSPLLILYSQLARYWALVFLLSAIYPYALYLGIRDRSRSALAVGIVTAVLAALAHPVSVLLFGGLGLWLLTRFRRPADLKQLWDQRSVRWGLVVALILLVVMIVRFIPILQGWIAQHDRTGAGQFLLRPRVGDGLRQLVYLAAFVDGLTLPLALAGVLGLYILWSERDRPLALLLICLAGFPIVFLTLISLRTAVSTYYLLPAIPVFFLGAGVFIDRLIDADRTLRPRWLLPAAVTLLIVAAGVPTLVSDYRDGRRYDFRRAAMWLETRLAAADVVFSDQPIVLAHYLPERRIQKLRSSSEALADSLRGLERAGAGGSVWVVAPAASHAFRSNLKAGGLSTWIYANCQLRNSLGVGRVDYRQEYLQIYRCPPGTSAAAEREPGTAAGN